MSTEMATPTTVDQIPVVRGSVIQTYNKAIKKSFLMVVLAATDVYTCIKLTDNPLFKRVNSIRIDVSKYDIDKETFKSTVTMYANVFGGTSIIKPEYVTKVFPPLKTQEYFGIITALTSYYLGFYHIESETGEYVIDTPYIRDPIYTMLFGMVPVSEVISQEVSSKTRNETYLKKDEEKEIDKKSSEVSKVKRSNDIAKVFEAMDKYPDNVQLRIETLFKAFSSYLLDGKFPIKQIYDAVCGEGLKLPRKNSFVITREEFAFIISASSVEIKEKFGLSSTVRANQIRRYTLTCYHGKKFVSYVKNDDEVNEYITALYTSIPNIGRKEAIKNLMAKFGFTELEANTAQKRYMNKGKTGYAERKKYAKTNMDDRVLNILSKDWISCFDKAEELQNRVFEFYPDRNKIYNGSIKVDTGDTIMDILILYAICKIVNNNEWYTVLTLPIYKDLRQKYVKYEFRDIRDRFANITKRGISNSFSKSAAIIAHIVCSLEEMDEKVLFLHKSAGLGNTKVDGKYLCKTIGIFYRSLIMPKILTNHIAHKVGLTYEQTYTMIKACVRSAEDIDIGIRKYKHRKKDEGEA